MTIDVPAGDAAVWVGLSRVWIEPRDSGAGDWFAVESSRAYRDRLVLKLEGIDDPDRAARLRGSAVEAAFDDAPELPAGEHWVSTLLGLDVHDEREGLLGTVSDVIPTGGVDLLVVRRADAGNDASRDDDDLMIPMAKAILLAVEPEQGRIRIRAPDGLIDLNRRSDRPPAGAGREGASS